MQRVAFIFVALSLLLNGRQRNTETTWFVSNAPDGVTEYSRPGCIITRSPDGGAHLVAFRRNPDGSEVSQEADLASDGRLREERSLYRQAGDFTWDDRKDGQVDRSLFRCSCTLGLDELPPQVARFISQRPYTTSRKQ
jgi:hypothetical protein